MFQTGMDISRILLRLPLFFVHADQLLATTCVFPETIICDPVKPGRKSGLPAKASNVLVSPEKCFLGKVICQGDVCAGELSQQTAHAGLMPPHEFPEGVLIVVDKNSRNEVRISELHSRDITVSGAEAECPFCFPISI